MPGACGARSWRALEQLRLITRRVGDPRHTFATPLGHEVAAVLRRARGEGGT